MTAGNAAYLDALKNIARAAGALELQYFHSGTDTIEKQDGSPVTVADREAEELILKGLKDLAPDIPVVAEESVAAGKIPDISSGRFWLVDPLDGTKEFISGSGEFTVNIALLEDFTPVLGVIYAPVVDEMYTGVAGVGCTFMTGKGPEEKIAVRGAPEEGLTVVSSKSHGDPDKLSAFLDGKKIAGHATRGSSLKFCAVASGRADIYPRFGPTCEWDTAAGDAILRAAGGSVTELDGTPLRYGKSDAKFLNPEFIARAA